MKRLILCMTTSILLLSACNSNTEKKSFLNERAAVPESIRSLMAHQKFVTSAMNKKSGTMSVLYAGNDTLTLLTWKVKSDKNWFGANVPDSLLTVEVLSDVAWDMRHAAYKSFNGDGKTSNQDIGRYQQRIGYIQSLKPSFLP